MTDKLEQFADRLFAPLGRFVVEFENLCETTRQACVRVFEHAGLQKREIAELTFAGLTATPLFDLYVSLTAQAFRLTRQQTEQLKDIRKTAQELVAVRNRAIHGTWCLIDFADIEHGAPDGVLSSNRRRPHGLDRDVSSLSPKQLMRLTEQAKELRDAIRNLSHALEQVA
ncbi:MAG: hypothetical protein NTZ17_19335 [Phycisphaerae bacterium]|nr:hypothetical protein [Phycisphaerae bacterium]